MRHSNKSKRKEKNFHMELPPILTMKECKKLGFQIVNPDPIFYTFKKICYYIDKSGRKGVCKIDGKLPKGK